MVLLDISRRYTRLESWFYDRFIADAVAETTRGLIDEVVAEVPSDGLILEVGSGGGQLALGLAERGIGLRVIGVDLSGEQVARAGRRVSERSPAVADRVRFQLGSALDLGFPDEHFDAVLSVGSIKHWADQAKGMAELVRVLRPGGLLLVVEVDRGCSLPDARAFVARLNAPWPLGAAALLGFRTYVAGQGLDLDDGRALVADRPLTRTRVERIPGDPTLLICGRKERS